MIFCIFKKILLILIISIFTINFICCKNINSIDKTFNDTTQTMLVHYIDVGQGDSILVQVNNKNLLIDSGPKANENKLLKYLNSLKIKTLHYVIATHPHEDHIGGMKKIINNFSIEKFYAPKVTNNTQTFNDMISALKNKKLKINIMKANIGNDIDLGTNVLVEIFSPNKDMYDNLNDYSPIMKITYNNNSFLFTGDAEKITELEVLEKKKNLNSTVLKVGHHGSSTSTTNEFIKAVSPQIAIISLAKENSYGHPHKKTLETLRNENVLLYRTDEDGTIVLGSDGTNIKKLN